MLDKKAMGALIQRRRKDQGMRQEDVSEKSGLSRSYICDVEKGRYIPSIDTLLKIAGALGVPVTDLMPLDQDQNESSSEVKLDAASG
jgi:transcriptional regulator with XRE-family HTH domain